MTEIVESLLREILSTTGASLLVYNAYIGVTIEIHVPEV
jgi:hypothetical protein